MDLPGQRPSRPWKKKNTMSGRTSMTRRRQCPRPRRGLKRNWSEKPWATPRSINTTYTQNCNVDVLRKVTLFVPRPILFSAGAGGDCSRPMKLPDPSPVLDKNCAPIRPEILSSTGAGVWRKAPTAFPDSSSVLDKFQSAICVFPSQKSFFLKDFEQRKSPQNCSK